MCLGPGPSRYAKGPGAPTCQTRTAGPGGRPSSSWRTALWPATFDYALGYYEITILFLRKSLLVRAMIVHLINHSTPCFRLTWFWAPPLNTGFRT